MTPYYQDDSVTIYHGDCRDVLMSLPKSDLILTDPPYGCDVTYTTAYNDDRAHYWDWFLPCLHLMRQKASTVVMTHGPSSFHNLRDYDWVMCWKKTSPGGIRIGNSQLFPQWEPIFVWGLHRYGTDTKGWSDVIECRPNIGQAKNRGVGRAKWNSGKASVYHPCPKPLDLFLRLVEIFGQKTETMVDPFMGTGTTLRAAKDMHHKAIGIEIEERYCEIAARRMEQEVLAL